MTITNILSDLEAKAQEVLDAAQDEREIAQQRQLWAIDAYRGACSPDHILALVAWVRELIRRAEALSNAAVVQTEPAPEHGLGAVRFVGFTAPHDVWLRFIDALASHLDAGEERT